MSRFSDFGNHLYTGERSIDFIGRRRTWYVIASAFVVASIAAVLFIGLNAGIEFKGGADFRVSDVRNNSQQLGTDAVGTVAPGDEVHVSTVGSDGIRVTTPTLDAAQSDQVKTALAKAYGVPETSVTSSFVGPSWGQDVSRKAFTGLIVFIILVAGVISLYFRTWKMAAAALIALLHDLMLTVGIYALIGFEVTPATVIGFLTILGYSLYDTVVVFDKVRENTTDVTHQMKHTYSEAANLAINQTLVRSINTSVVALLPVGSILFIGAFLLGAGTLRDISLALFVGIAAGTYSSIFIATPLLVDLRRREPALVAHAQKVLRKRAEGTGGSAASPVPSGAESLEDGGGDPFPTTARAGAGPATTVVSRPAAGNQRAQPRKGGQAKRRS